MSVTDPEIVEAIASATGKICFFDPDTCEYAIEVEEAVRHMLADHVEMIASAAPEDEVARKEKAVLCEDYLGFYLVAKYDIGGSLVDYCSGNAFDAMEGYEIAGFADADEMIDEIEPGLEHALRPDEILEELAGIGIA